MTRKIAVAIGDPNGIGPEIAVKAAAQFSGSEIEPVLVGDEFVMRTYLERHAGRAIDRIRLAPVDALDRAAFSPGTLDPRAGAATVSYVRRAFELVERGEAEAIVGCPHSEAAINRAGIAFSGYPGLVAELTGTPRDHVFLMLVAAGLRIAHVTLHESVRTALGRITTELVVAAGRATAEALERLGVRQPRIGVFGINPHAGEEGLFGEEDEHVTKPAVAKLLALGVRAEGPVGGDLILSQRRHDAYVAMFHDQGHIPVKLLSPLRASALSIGAPVLFSSVGHGCAYDIAGKGIADPASVLDTLALMAGVAAA
jgi:4-hydroxy-L-threonine phosphate dehydrogenase PdxA